jgi:hypothetical protein
MNRLSRDRNRTCIFAERTQKNLVLIARSAREGRDVHPVTQAVSALLGVVVFPWETSAFDVVKKRKLPVLSATGWPKWAMSGPRRVIELGDLIHVLRNAIAHGRIEFDSDSRNPNEVTITFENIPEGSTEPDWMGKISGDQLIDFCRCFTSEIRAQVD